MTNQRKVVLWLTFMAFFAISMLSSCKSDESKTRYVAAKLVDSDMWSIVDLKTGDIIHKDEFKSQPSIIVNDKFCVKNANGLYDYFSVQNVTKPINTESFLYASAFNENDIALAVLKGKGISIINGKCEVVSNLDNSIISANDFSNGYSIVTNDEYKKGYINEKGEIIIKPIYDKASSFSPDGLTIVGKEVNDSITKYFVIDTKGKEFFSFSSNEYKEFGTFIGGYFPVQKENDEVVILDKTGKKHCSIGKWKGYIPDWLGFYDDVIVFKDAESFGLKNGKGEIVIRAKYDELIPLPMIDKNIYLAKKQDKYGIIDKDDKVIIPFDYSILGYLNKDILFVGEGKTFSFMNKELKDVGHNNYTNLSFMTGSSIHSNYFNADKEARKIISNITDSRFFKTKKGMMLRDFKDKLSGYKYADMNETSLRDYDYPFSYLYAFDQHLSSQRYEYIYGYSFPTSPEYNYNANLAVVFAINSTYSNFQPGSEESLAKAFDSQIQKKGFKPVVGKPNWFENDKGMAVALAYEDGTVSVMCAYLPRYMSLEAKRIPRKESSKNDIQVDYIDTFGFEIPVDSLAVTEVETAK